MIERDPRVDDRDVHRFAAAPVARAGATRVTVDTVEAFRKALSLGQRLGPLQATWNGGRLRWKLCDHPIPGNELDRGVGAKRIQLGLGDVG